MRRIFKTAYSIHQMNYPGGGKFNMPIFTRIPDNISENIFSFFSLATFNITKRVNKNWLAFSKEACKRKVKNLIEINKISQKSEILPLIYSFKDIKFLKELLTIDLQKRQKYFFEKQELLGLFLEDKTLYEYVLQNKKVWLEEKKGLDDQLNTRLHKPLTEASVDYCIQNPETILANPEARHYLCDKKIILELLEKKPEIISEFLKYKEFKVIFGKIETISLGDIIKRSEAFCSALLDFNCYPNNFNSEEITTMGVKQPKLAAKLLDRFSERLSGAQIYQLGIINEEAAAKIVGSKLGFSVSSKQLNELTNKALKYAKRESIKVDVKVKTSAITLKDLTKALKQFENESTHFSPGNTK